MSPAPILLSVALGLKLAAAPACPGVDALRRALAAVGDPADGAGAEARVERLPDGLRVTLSRTDGARLQQTLAASGSCGDLAQAAAVTLAILDARFGTAPRTVVLPRLDVGAEAEAEPVPSRLAGGVGLGVAGAYAASASSVGGSLFAWLGRRGGPWSGSASLLFDGPRQASLGTGQASWEREAVGLGGRFAPAWGDWTLAGEAQLLLGALEVAGSHFGAADYTEAGFDLGAALSLRLCWTRFRLAPWIGVQGVAWFLGRQAVADGASAPLNLSTLELWGGVGGLYRFE
ncbi:MAG: hypothetical protein ACYDCL_11300 [Myxococcales bacterium]